jgi:glutamate formiminotransferase
MHRGRHGRIGSTAVVAAFVPVDAILAILAPRHA